MSRAHPSTPADTAARAGGRDAALDARIKRSAVLLAACAIAFYVGFIVWNLWRTAP
jgi:hypothetical protein